MNFEIVGEITEIETIAISGSIRFLPVAEMNSLPGGESGRGLRRYAWRMGTSARPRSLV